MSFFVTDPQWHTLDGGKPEQIDELLGEHGKFNNISAVKSIARLGKFHELVESLNTEIPNINLKYHLISYKIANADYHHSDAPEIQSRTDEDIYFHLVSTINFEGQDIIGPFFSSLGHPIISFGDELDMEMNDRETLITSSIEQLINDGSYETAVIYNPHSQKYSIQPESVEEDNYISKSPTTHIMTGRLSGKSVVTQPYDENQLLPEYTCEDIVAKPNLFTLIVADHFLGEQQARLFGICAEVIGRQQQFHYKVKSEGEDKFEHELMQLKTYLKEKIR